jgi:hypothetical protein
MKTVSSTPKASWFSALSFSHSFKLRYIQGCTILQETRSHLKSLGTSARDLCNPGYTNFLIITLKTLDKWVPVTTAWRVLRLPTEERPPIWRVAANILKQSRTADKGWSSSLGVGRGANNCSPYKRILLRNVHRESPGSRLILWLRRGTAGGHLWMR